MKTKTILALGPLFNDKLKATVLDQALRHRHAASPQARRALQAVLNQVPIEGFRTGLKAPLVKQLQKLSALFKRSEPVMWSVLISWVDSQSSLYQKVRRHLIEQQLSIYSPSDLPTRLSPWTRGQFDEVHEGLCREYTDEGREVLALMLCCVTGRFPDDGNDINVVEDPDIELFENDLSDEPSVDATEDRTSDDPVAARIDFDQWIRELELLSLEPDHSSEFEAFLAKAADIFRLRARRIELRQEIESFRRDSRELLQFFLYETSDWTADVSVTEKPETIRAQFSELFRLMSEHRRMMSSPPTSLADSRKQRDELASLELNIERCFRELDGKLRRENDAGSIPHANNAATGQASGHAPDATERASLSDQTAGETCESHSLLLDLKQKPSGLSDEVYTDADLTPSALSKDPEEHCESVDQSDNFNHIDQTPSGGTDLLASPSPIGTIQVERRTAKAESVEADPKLVQSVESATVNVINPHCSQTNTARDQSDASGIQTSNATSAQNTTATMEQPINGACELQGDAVTTMPFLPDVIKTELLELSTETIQQVRASLSQTNRDWEPQIWNVLSKGDISAAYWIARGLEEAQVMPVVPSWLLATLQGALWATPDRSILVGCLSQYIRRDLELSQHQQMLAFAAALPLALVAPEIANVERAPLRAWLVPPEALQVLTPLAESIDEFSNYNRPIQASTVATIVSDEQRQTDIAAAQRSLVDFIEERQQRKRATRFHRASDVYFALVRPGGKLHEFARPIIEGRLDKVVDIRRNAAFWKDRRKVHALIDEIDRALVGMKNRQAITSDPLQTIIDLCTETADRALLWCDIVQRELKREDEWFCECISQLRTTVEQSLKNATAVLEGGTASASDSAVFHCVRKSLARVAELLCIPSRGLIPDHTGPSTVWFLSHSELLESALSRRLLYLPEIKLNSSGATDADGIANAALLLGSRESDRSEREALAIWAGRHDYRFTNDLLEAVSDTGSREDLRKFVESSRTADREVVRHRIQEIEREVRQAVIDGVLDDREAEEYQDRFDEVIGDTSEEFHLIFDELTSIRSRLSEALIEKEQSILARWGSLRLTAFEADSDPTILSRIDELMEGLLARKNLRAAVQLLDSADIISVYGNRDIDTELMRLVDSSHSNDRDVLAEFLSIEETVFGWLKDNAVLTATTFEDPLHLPSRIERARGKIAGCLGPIADVTRRREAAAMMETYLALLILGFTPHDKRINAAELIARLLRVLGFVRVGAEDQPVIALKSDPDWMFFKANNWSDGGNSPVPTFGSDRTEGNQSSTSLGSGYSILCVWNNYPVERLETLLDSSPEGKNPLVVLYLDAISPNIRRKMREVSVRRKFPFIVLDAVMLLFLAHERESLLQSLFYCTLPFSCLMPYIRDRSGAVAREIFFGREDMVDRLWNPDGTCLIYGGRQLGKSALQHHIARRYDRRDKEQYVWVLDMNAIYAPQKGNTIEHIWNALRECFSDNLFKGRNITSLRPETIAEHIRQAVTAVPGRRVLMFLDEADEFLEAGERENFHTVNMLCTLMENTSWRFKVIFAGNRNVQRFSNIPNQRLTRNGDPVVVGPLETLAAMDLVRRPAEAIGFRYVDQSTILRILSYTSRHANLLQFFMHELLTERYRKISKADSPPYIITEADVDDAYNRPNVRSIMHQRIDLTLQLDDDYRLICFAAALDQWPGDENLTRFYGTTELLTLARENWAAGFAETTFTTMRSKLDEMCGLGLLIRNREGQYRLSSPSLLRLFGSPSDIREQILEIGQKPRQESLSEADRHAWVGKQAGRYTPLNFAQDALLKRDRTAVRLVFSSNALGLSEIIESLPRLLPDPTLGFETGCEQVMDEVSGRSEWNHYLTQQWAKMAASGNYVMYQILKADNPEQIRARIAAAVEFCGLSHVQRNQKRSLRIVFLFTPPAAWAWLGLASPDREALENRCQQIIVPQKWQLRGIQRRLQETGRLYTPEICRQVSATTCGWPFLLDQLLLRSWNHADEHPTDACESLKRDLTRSTPFAETFRRNLDVDVSNSVLKVWLYLCSQREPIYKLLVEDDTNLGLDVAELENALTFLKWFGLCDEATDSRGDQIIVADPVAVSVWN